MALTEDDKTWVEEKLDHLEAKLVERMRDMQTELLKAFLPFRESVGLRETDLEQRQNVLGERQAVLDRRLTEIEKKLLIQPPEGTNGKA